MTNETASAVQILSTDAGWVPVYNEGRFWYFMDPANGYQPVEPLCATFLMEDEERVSVIRYYHQLADQSAKAGKAYFIGGEMGAIKIGYSIDPKNRLRTLQLSSPIVLRILATAPGGQDREAAYHAQFESHRLHGEWFERHPDILAEIDRLNSHPLASAIGGAAALSGAR